MTENEMQKLDIEVYNTPPTDLDDEKEWIETQLFGNESFEGLFKQNSQLIAAYRMNRFLHDDARCKAIALDLKKVREAIEYLTRRKIELEDNVLESKL